MCWRRFSLGRSSFHNACLCSSKNGTKEWKDIDERNLYGEVVCFFFFLCLSPRQIFFFFFLFKCVISLGVLVGPFCTGMFSDFLFANHITPSLLLITCLTMLPCIVLLIVQTIVFHFEANQIEMVLHVNVVEETNFRNEATLKSTESVTMEDRSD